MAHLPVLKQFSILLMHVRHQLTSMKMAISTMQMPRINDWHVMVRLPLFLRCCAKIYEPESNVVAKNKKADTKNSTIINDGNGK